MVSFAPGGPLRGSLRPPADKSISHRAAILAAMAEGESRIENYLDSEDTRSTLVAMQQLGARFREGEPKSPRKRLSVVGAGLRGLAEAHIDVGNAGTLYRLLPGWLAGQPGRIWTLDGDESIRRRPIDRVAEPLALMGAELSCREGRFAPVTITGTSLNGIEYVLPVASAQVKSCVLLAGLMAEGETTVVERTPSRDHTERMLNALGAEIEVVGEGGECRITISPAGSLQPGNFRIPGDFSSAAFFLVAAALAPGSELRIEAVGVNPTRTGLLRILERMGAGVDVIDERQEAGEPVADLLVRHAPLRGTVVSAEDVPAAIDELPLVALLGCFAEGETIVTGAEELRYKESDRIAGVVDGLSALGAEIEPLPNGFAVNGTGGLRGGILDARGDHRLAMLGAIAGIASREGVEVRGMDAAVVSYPDFERDLAGLL